MIHPSGIKPWLAGALWVALAFSAWSARTATLYGIELDVTPADPFIFQPCSLELRITLSPGAVLRSPRIEGLPDPTILEIGPLREHPVKTLRRNGRTLELRRYSAPTRPLSEGRLEFTPTLQASLLERRGGLFVNSWIEKPLRQTLKRVELVVRALPAEGRPGNFGMAVGQFDLSAHLEPVEIELGGLVTLVAEVTGKGWPGEIAPAFFHPPEPFRVYPPRIVVRKPQGVLRSEQTLVARDVDADALPPIVFPYFDPQSERYREARAGPFPIRVHPATNPSATNKTMLSLEPPGFPAASQGTREAIGSLLKHSPGFYLKIWGRPLLLFLLFLLPAAICFTRRRGGKVLPPLLLATGLIVFLISLQRSTRSVHAREFSLQAPTELRLAPGENAMVLRSLPRDTRVEALETWQGWHRIRAGKNVGWIEHPDHGGPGAPASSQIFSKANH